MYEDVEEFLNKRAESHNSRYGYLPSKHCDVNVLKEIHRRHVYYCKLMEITSESEKRAVFKQRIVDYMRVLRTGFVKDVINTLVWEDIELLPDGHRMKPPYKISVYTEWRDDFDLKSLRSEND
tara:strand:- start:221 stop:589 length:369 start_codon:yes stop_codon:yes gene_type:complete